MVSFLKIDTIFPGEDGARSASLSIFFFAMSLYSLINWNPYYKPQK